MALIVHATAMVCGLFDALASVMVIVALDVPACTPGGTAKVTVCCCPAAAARLPETGDTVSHEALVETA